jgi:predicted porin
LANTTGYDAGLKYANGPIMAAVTYNAVSLGNAAKTDISDFRVGGTYDFGMASVRACSTALVLTTSAALAPRTSSVWAAPST